MPPFLVLLFEDQKLSVVVCIIRCPEKLNDRLSVGCLSHLFHKGIHICLREHQSGCHDISILDIEHRELHLPGNVLQLSKTVLITGDRRFPARTLV